MEVIGFLFGLIILIEILILAGLIQVIFFKGTNWYRLHGMLSLNLFLVLLMLFITKTVEGLDPFIYSMVKVHLFLIGCYMLALYPIMKKDKDKNKDVLKEKVE